VKEGKRGSKPVFSVSSDYSPGSGSL